MTAKQTLKRSQTVTSSTKTKTTKHEILKVDLVSSNWLRNNLTTKYKKPYLIPMELIQLIWNYQLYISIFDIYYPLRFILKNNKHETLIETTHNSLCPKSIKLPPSTIISSKYITNGNSVQIKLLKKLTNSYYLNKT